MTDQVVSGSDWIAELDKSEVWRTSQPRARDGGFAPTLQGEDIPGVVFRTSIEARAFSLGAIYGFSWAASLDDQQ